MTGVRPLSAASAEQQLIDAQLRAELDGVGRSRRTDEQNSAPGPGYADGGSGGGTWCGHTAPTWPYHQPDGRQRFDAPQAGPGSGRPAPYNEHSGSAPVGNAPWPGPMDGPNRPPAPGRLYGREPVYGPGPSAAPAWPSAGWAQGRPRPSEVPSGGGHPREFGGRESGRAWGPVPAPQTNDGARGNRQEPEWGPAPMPPGGGEHQANHTVETGLGPPAAVGTRGSLHRGRRRRRSVDSGSPPRRRRRTAASSYTASSSSEDDMEDRRQSYRRAPVRSTAAAAPADLRLPAVQARAERRLRNRRRFVSVADAADAAETRPASSVEYTCRVAEIMTHTVYHFPECGLQAICYLAWLLWQAVRHPLRAVAAADSRARQTMALRPRDYLTAADLDRFMVPVTGAGDGRTTEGRRGEARRGQTCFLYEQHNACSNPCRAGRIHPRCGACGSRDHPSAFHGPAGAGHRGGFGGLATFGRGGAGRGALFRGGAFR
ncbi:translation initiation factor IF-2-like [Amphibalanus amphitrite]|uniref:translation initiation factor IF-2-like n=1 Tax=Amphibalanus amphitrite TaxID=1232801 RepID=UPI001C9034F1|nr:translation initiation factor IF-2-like [Amphibalanus amphitrite]